MTISTQDCKDFIDSIGHIIHASSSDKWKRVKKYKEEDLILRDFENQDGRTLTIAEIATTSDLFLYQLQGTVTLNISACDNLPEIQGRKSIGHPVTENDIFKFMAECVEKDHSIVDNEPETVEAGIEPLSWTVWQTWSKKFKNSNNYDEIPLKDYFKDNDGSWGEFDLFYADENGDIPQVSEKEIIQVFWVGMRDYDTAYRIYVFETYDHQLWLGVNNPD